MSDKMQKNVNILRVTNEGIKKLCEMDHRSDGEVIDWLVAQELLRRSVTQDQGYTQADEKCEKPE